LYDQVIISNNEKFAKNNITPWGINLPQGTGNEELDRLLHAAGYVYDQAQDIFYSTLDPWQRNLGYCRLYDEVGAPLSMIMDCEPIYFEYEGEKWLIEFWKGQYGMVTGGEIGVYTGGIDLNILGFWRDTIYKCASNGDLLQMSYTLKKGGKILFTREGWHWWLTGFILGEFSEPEELVMDLQITLKDENMLEAFLDGLREAGYSNDEITVSGNTVSLTFDTPHTKQPFTRIPSTDWLIQRKNELLCNKYQEITKPYDSFDDKVKAIEEDAPYLYDQIIRIGKAKNSFEIYEAVIMITFVIGLFISSRIINSQEP